MLVPFALPNPPLVAVTWTSTDVQTFFPLFARQQDEFSLLCRVASQADLADNFQLRATEGWQNLQAILQSTGERLPKRRRELDSAPAVAPHSSSLAAAAAPSSSSDPGEPLAKRFAAFRLNERRTLAESSSSSSRDPEPDANAVDGGGRGGHDGE